LPGRCGTPADNLNVYFSYGQGFETPTFAELAYKPTGPGLNFNLDPATSTAYELGLKWLPAPTQRLNLAVFTAQTKQEIVVNTATGGRTTYANAGRTERRGVEAEWDADLGHGVAAHVNYTWLLAQFADAYTSGTPPVVIPAGAKLPGVPSQQAFGVLSWTPGGYSGFNASVEGQRWARCTPTIAIPPSRRPTPSATCRRASRKARARQSHGVRAAQQLHQREIRGLGDRRRHQCALFRAGAGTQLVPRRERRGDTLSHRSRIAEPSRAGAPAFRGQRVSDSTGDVQRFERRHRYLRHYRVFEASSPWCALPDRARRRASRRSWSLPFR
jgi:hypothetical protein